MKDWQRTRRHPRVTLPQRLRATLGLSGDLWVVNLSPGGAMIEHTDRLPPGQTGTFALLVAGVALRLRARVVWSRVHSITATGEEEIRFRSGLQFTDLSGAAEAHLREYLATPSNVGAARADTGARAR